MPGPYWMLCAPAAAKPFAAAAAAAAAISAPVRASITPLYRLPAAAAAALGDWSSR